MSLGFPVKVDWDYDFYDGEYRPNDLPEVVILPAEVCRKYYEEKDIWQLLDWLVDEYGWRINGVELLNESR